MQRETEKNILIFFLFVVVFFLLKAMSGILIPLVLALLFAMMFQPLVVWFGKRNVPHWVVLPVISFMTLVFLFFVSGVFIRTFTDFLSQKDFVFESLHEKFDSLLLWINNSLGFSVDRRYLTTAVRNVFDKDLLTSTIGSTAKGIGSFSASFFMFALYFIILLSGMSQYRRYINHISHKKNSGEILEYYENIQRSISTYIAVKFVISLVTGSIAGLICVLFGIQFPLFWGLLTFMLNFIPSIGSIIATFPPFLMAFVQFESLLMPFYVLLSLGVIQIFMGNVIEPVILGDRLRLNTVTVIFGLVFWGYIWGVPGMLLSVPLLVLMKLVLERSSSFRVFARMMEYPDKKARDT
ncbi:MAG: AI-2E family transporter [bacterium]